MTNFEKLQEGKQAFQDGVKVTQAPYKKGSKDYRAWVAGWHHQRALEKHQ